MQRRRKHKPTTPCQKLSQKDSCSLDFDTAFRHLQQWPGMLGAHIPLFHCILRKNILMTSFFNPFSYFVARKMSDFWGLLQNILEGVALVPNLTALLQCDLIEGLLAVCSSLRCLRFRFVTNPGHCDVIPWFLNTQHICRTSWNIVEHLATSHRNHLYIAEHAWLLGLTDPRGTTSTWQRGTDWHSPSA